MDTPHKVLVASDPQSLTASHHPFDIQCLAWSDWPSVVPQWSWLAAESPRRSFFLSKNWVDTWITVFGPLLRPQILSVQPSPATGRYLPVGPPALQTGARSDSPVAPQHGWRG